MLNIFIKAVFYRLFASVFIFFTSYLFVKEPETALYICLIEFVAKMLLYIVYEKFWKKIQENEIDT